MADAILPDPSAQFKSWREALHVHPDCLKLPPALPGEVATLASEIARQVVLMPLVFRIPEGKTTDDAELLDGRNRLDALTQRGYRFAWVKGKGPHMRDPDDAVTELRFELKTAGEVPSRSSTLFHSMLCGATGPRRKSEKSLPSYSRTCRSVRTARPPG
jgi:hypothetical protein